MSGFGWECDGCHQPASYLHAVPGIGPRCAECTVLIWWDHVVGSHRARLLAVFTDRAKQLDQARRVTVCISCLKASCWHGVFMCDASDWADTTTRTVAELDALDREHPDHYSAERVREVCGS